MHVSIFAGNLTGVVITLHSSEIRESQKCLQRKLNISIDKDKCIRVYFIFKKTSVQNWGLNKRVWLNIKMKQKNGNQGQGGTCPSTFHDLRRRAPL